MFWSKRSAAPSEVKPPETDTQASVSVQRTVDELASPALKATIDLIQQKDLLVRSPHATKASSSLSDEAIAGGAAVPRETLIEAALTPLERVNSFSNQLHIKVDWAAALGAYGFGSGMHVLGQGTPLCTMSMWLAGTCFIMNSQNRAVCGPGSDIFQFEAVASWIWMLTSFQQFRQFKVMKYAGYSSWTGLGLCTYFSSRHLYNTLVN